MKSPFTGGEAVLITEPRKAVFRREEYEYIHLCYECIDTHETFTTTHLDMLNASQVYNSYRTAHDIPYPDEIKEMRNHYKLSASKMSKILGFGDNQYRLYENGEIPNIANGRVLRAIQSPFTFETFVDVAKTALSESEYSTIKQRLEEGKETFPVGRFMRNLIYDDNARNQYNGYAMLSLSKLKNVLLFYIEKLGGVFVTQMNKLLFYTDFLSYREYGQAITGLSFKALQFGPVPNNWDKVYSLIDDIRQEEVYFESGALGTKLVSDISYDIYSFTPDQLSIIEKVYETFKEDNSTTLSDKSHKESAWIENQKTHSIIDFKYAFSLKAI